MPNQTSKKPSGKYDRSHLTNYLVDSAKASTVGSDYVTYEKKTRGRVYEPKRKPKATSDDMDEIEKLLLGMSESDLGELAGKFKARFTVRRWHSVLRASWMLTRMLTRASAKTLALDHLQYCI